MKRFLTLLVPAITIGWTSPAVNGQEQPPRLLPQDLEVELALSALPGHLRSEATVYVLRRGEGFVPVLEGANAYTCYVQRTLWYLDTQTPNALIPMCYDRPGTEAYTPVDFDDARYREQGLTSAQIKAKIQKGFEEGKYQAPERTGISFMLSPIQEIPRGDGSIFRFVPHYMFYAPGLKNEELGLGKPWLFNIPALRREGGPHAMFIVRAGELEREMIEEDAAELIARVNTWIQKGS